MARVRSMPVSGLVRLRASFEGTQCAGQHGRGRVTVVEHRQKYLGRHWANSTINLRCHAWSGPSASMTSQGGVLCTFEQHQGVRGAGLPKEPQQLGGHDGVRSEVRVCCGAYSGSGLGSGSLLRNATTCALHMARGCPYQRQTWWRTDAAGPGRAARRPAAAHGTPGRAWGCCPAATLWYDISRNSRTRLS